MLNEPLIFLHIPKTGGVSLKLNLNSIFDFEVQRIDLKSIINTPLDWDINLNNYHIVIPNNTMWEHWVYNSILDENYKKNNKIIETHINMWINQTNSIVIRDICSEKINPLYKSLNWMTMLRDPVERIISEYYFFYKGGVTRAYNESKECKGTFKPSILIKKTIDKYNSLIDYISDENHRNSQTKFLKGIGWLDGEALSTPVSDEDCDFLIERMEEFDFKVGITEKMNNSIKYFNKAFNINIDTKDIKLNINKEKEIVDNKIKKIIREYNQVDYKLYNYFLDKLNNG